jgi:inner membrane transporter RhtA
VVLSLLGLQGGAAVATTLLAEVGAAGVVTLRLGLAALVLAVLCRPSLRLTRRQWRVAASVGAVLCVHHLGFYAAVARVPLGTATTIEFLGPFAIALSFSRTRADLLWAFLALAGVVLVAAPTGATDRWGLVCAALAGGAWAGYILLARPLGRALPGGTGLTVAVGIGALLSLPVGLGTAGTALADPQVLLVGACVAVLSTVGPYLLQLLALRRLHPRGFSLLSSLEPAVAALVGLSLLGQRLDVAQWLGVLAVVTASAAATAAHHRVAADG